MKVFVTGASGFVGRVLLRQLLETTEFEIVALSRQPRPEELESESRIRWVEADLMDGAACYEALGDCGAIVHLAAVTGKVDPYLYERVILEGTKRLLTAARDRGNIPILNVSTIAVKFPDLVSYPYAKAKQRAERAVATSGVPYLTIRPTIVLGSESGVWLGFRQMATLPVGLIFGPGETEIQPIHVDDLVGCIIAALKEERFNGESLDIGGPNKTTINNFWQTIRTEAGLKPGPLIHAPLSLVMLMVRMLEAVAYKFTPLTVGQMSVFRFSSLPEANTFQLKRMRSMKNVEEMVIAAEAETPPPTLDPEAECEVFCRYLIGESPSEYVVEQYSAALQTEKFQQQPSSAFDFVLGRFALRHPLFTGLADAYSRFLRPAGTLRRKLVLMLAILESTAASEQIDQADGGGLLSFLFQSTIATLGFIGRLIGGVALFAPLQILTAVRSK
ncbi:MAG: NAD(P)-dependent oxidoreductase [Verrucomicrobiota bacterium]